jgi:hypothetical protein
MRVVGQDGYWLHLHLTKTRGIPVRSVERIFSGDVLLYSHSGEEDLGIAGKGRDYPGPVPVLRAAFGYLH